jgi:molecular chaperone IbpA
MYDFSPLWRSSVGFERILDQLNNMRPGDKPADFPPYDIERFGEDRYRISLPVAGFSPDEISITAQQNLLSVSGQKAEAPSAHYLHQGIAGRSFKLRFALEDHVEVRGAAYENGLLKIDLVRNLPETMKPRRIEIAEGSARTKADEGKIIEHARAA